MSRTMIAAALLFLTTPLLAQTIYTPEIHIGSATTPSTITVPPVELITSEPTGPRVSEATPASTELLASRHFDFIASPSDGVRLWNQGTLSDNSISLGDYARELRAKKQKFHKQTNIR